jgi:hypothetical protein
MGQPPEHPAMKSLCLASLIVLASATTAFAQLKLEIKDGRVSLDAKSVPARQILAEWAKIGGTRIVGGDKVTGAPLTLKFADLPERQALDIILRNVAGYMAAPRQASAAAGASAYDRILILATSTPPANAAATAGRGSPGTTANTQPGMGPANRRVPPRPPNLPPSPADNDVAEQAEQQVEDQADTGVQPPVFTFPQPQQQQGAPNQIFDPAGQNGRAGSAPVITLQPNANGQPTVYTFVPNGDGQPVQAAPAGPTTPFGAVGAPTPGMIQQPPPQPGQPQRPPKE